MSDSSDDVTDLLERLAARDESALEALFDRMRERLRRMVRYRIDPRLRGRVDADDVLQEAWIAAVQRIDTFDTTDETAVFVWLRRIVGQSLVELHRKHLGAKMRSAGAEVRIDAPAPDSMAMSAMLVASLTSPSGAAMRAESHERLVAAIDAMDPVDREIVMLRHFEELGNEEVAAVLGLTRSTASYRYVKALGKLRHVLDAR